eukprot:scaffold65392_cov47-Phaeocystis_antarctica.AAC.3
MFRVYIPPPYLLLGYVYQVTLGCITGLHSDCPPGMHSPWELTQLRKGSFVNSHCVSGPLSGTRYCPRLVTGSDLPVTALDRVWRSISSFDRPTQGDICKSWPPTHQVTGLPQPLGQLFGCKT